MKNKDKPLLWFSEEIKTSPFSKSTRLEAGFLLRQLQKGVKLSLPHSRAMTSIGTNCHELRLSEKNQSWRIIYKVEDDSILILSVFKKKTAKTPVSIIDTCKKRIKHYYTVLGGGS